MSKNVVELPPVKLASGEGQGLSEADRRGQADLIEWSRSFRPQTRPSEPQVPLSETDQAVRALEAEGHERITEPMVQDWIRARKGAAPPAPANCSPDSQPSPEAAQPAQKPKRRRGRPPIDKLWVYQVARLYAQGLTVRKALCMVGVTWLSEAQIRGVYRLKRFRELVAHWRREYFKD